MPIKACFCRFSAKSSCSRSRRASRNCVLSCRLRWQTGEYACSTTGIRRDQRKRKDLRRAQAYLPDDRGMRQNTSEASGTLNNCAENQTEKQALALLPQETADVRCSPHAPFNKSTHKNPGISEYQKTHRKQTQKTDTGRREFPTLSERKNMPNTISTYAVF